MQLPRRPTAWKEGDTLGWERQELGGFREEQEDASQSQKGVKKLNGVFCNLPQLVSLYFQYFKSKLF